METETQAQVENIRKPRKRKAQVQDGGATEIQKVANLPVVVSAFGRKYTIKKFTLGQIAQAVVYVGPLQYAVQQIADHKGTLSRGQIASIVLASLSQSGYSIIGLISVATSEPSEWIEEQDDPIGAMEILTATVEKNADFFSQQNIARVKALLGRLQQAIPALSGITSTPSSSTDTDH